MPHRNVRTHALCPTSRGIIKWLGRTIAVEWQVDEKKKNIETQYFGRYFEMLFVMLQKDDIHIGSHSTVVVT